MEKTIKLELIANSMGEIDKSYSVTDNKLFKVTEREKCCSCKS